MSTAPKNAPPANAAEEKAKALQAVLAQIEEQFGKDNYEIGRASCRERV